MGHHSVRASLSSLFLLTSGAIVAPLGAQIGINPVPAPRLSIAIVPTFANRMSIDSIADLNGDGVRDILVGLADYDSVQIRSGSSGSLLATITAPFPGTDFGAKVVSIGDLNGDGLEEIAVGAPTDGPYGIVYVYTYTPAGGVFVLRAWGPSTFSSASTSLYGSSITRLGDLNGDGVEELAVGAPAHTAGGPVTTLNGLVEVVNAAPATPVVLSTLIGTTWEELGDSLVSLGDLNGDGRRELAIGASRRMYGGSYPGTVPGSCRVYSGLSLVLGAPLQLVQLTGQFADDEFGHAIGNLGDVNGDGLDELIVGAPDLTNSLGSFSTTHSGAALAAGNPTPGVVVNGPAPTDRRFGWSISGGIGDISGDGKPDFVVGAPAGYATPTGAAYIVNGRTGAIVFRLTVAGGSQQFGYDVSELAASQWMVADPGTGKLYVY